MQRQISGFLVGQKHAVLAQHKGAYFFRAGHRCRIILLHLLEQKVVFAVHQFAGEEPLGKILQVAHEPRIVDALGAHRAVHTVGDNVGQLTDQLRCPHGIVAGLRVLPGVDDMEGDVARLFVRQLDAKLCLYLLQAALAHRILLGIKMLDFPEDAVGHHKTLLLALHCKMQVVGQQQIDMRRKLDSQRLLCVVHNVLRQFQIGCRNAGKQLQHRLCVRVGQWKEHAV